MEEESISSCHIQNISSVRKYFKSSILHTQDVLLRHILLLMEVTTSIKILNFFIIKIHFKIQKFFGSIKRKDISFLISRIN